ncbi:hypothetical protein CEXT_329111 [Caerostris extrusa]|uniref:Uncharacterized protein n=1 Tax=Caerostris extrusa TaxID=172846 RepID=A0AAV4NR09_CAEEX|nr:hypothetical protein CEXT_329111 [Caerostris extrusa]
MDKTTATSLPDYKTEITVKGETPKLERIPKIREFPKTSQSNGNPSQKTNVQAQSDRRILTFSKIEQLSHAARGRRKRATPFAAAATNRTAIIEIIKTARFFGRIRLCSIITIACSLYFEV